MRNISARFLFLSLFLAFSFMTGYDCYAQEFAREKREGRKVKRSFPELFKSSKHRGGSGHHKEYISIYKTTAVGAYSGNACAQRAANSMGFQFVLHYANCEKEHSKLNNFLHNQGAYISIIFKNGIFWKHRFKKRAQACL